jgi:hypothetical protein
MVVFQYINDFNKLSELEQKRFIKKYVSSKKLNFGNTIEFENEKHCFLFSPEKEIFVKSLKTNVITDFKSSKDLKKFFKIIEKTWTIENFIKIIECLIKEIYIFDLLNKYWVYQDNNIKSLNQIIPFLIKENEEKSVKLSFCEKEKILHLYLCNHQWLFLLLFKVFIWHSKFSKIIYSPNRNVFSILDILDNFLKNKKELNETNLKQLKDDLFPDYLKFCWYDYYKNRNILFSFFILILHILKIRFNAVSMRDIVLNLKFIQETLEEFCQFTLEIVKIKDILLLKIVIQF